MVLRTVRESWTTGVGDSLSSSASDTTPGGQFFTEGPGVGDRKWFTTAERVTSIAETADGLWRLLLYGSELLWMHRLNLRPVAGSRVPATGYGLTFEAGLTDAQVAAKVKAAAADVKDGASDRAAKYGA